MYKRLEEWDIGLRNKYIDIILSILLTCQYIDIFFNLFRIGSLWIKDLMLLDLEGLEVFNALKYSLE